MKNKKITIFLLIIFVFAVGVVIYSIKSSDSENTTGSLVPVGVTDTDLSGERTRLADRVLSGQGEEILRLLSMLKGIDIDVNFFNDPLFRSLEDFSIQLPIADIGVPNPFAPF